MMKQFCLSVCLLVWISCWGCQPSLTNSLPLSANKPKENQESVMNQSQPPTTVIDAVTQDISKRTGIAVNQLKIQETEAKTWSDGCLGLAKSGEFCTQALVDGWRIVVSDGSKNWVYRTDGTGQSIRLES
jgi:hypothetical protein